MIVVVPENEEHDEDSTTCPCGPAVIFEDGEMIIVHEHLRQT